jgi:hypothetical protein
MTYALDVVARARGHFRVLGIEAQEAVLDELDRIAARPHSIPAVRHVHDLVIQSGSSRQYVFLELEVIHPKHLVRVLGMGGHASKI